MPLGWSELYPSTPYPIEFRPLDDLINESRYDIRDYSSLEPPQQESLEEFETINRDYCIVKSPGKTSWQDKESQKNLEFEIFHTDIVKIPQKSVSEKVLLRGIQLSLLLKPLVPARHYACEYREDTQASLWSFYTVEQRVNR
jgi:hypothetical protein